jgi:hypothetical protein
MRTRVALLLGLALLAGRVQAQQPETCPAATGDVDCFEKPRQPTDNLDGRWRILFQGGVTHISVIETAAETRVSGPSMGFQLSSWIRPDVALDFRLHMTDLEAFDGIHTESATMDIGYLFGARYHPKVPGGLRPHVGASIGAFSMTRAVSSRGADVAEMGDTRLGGTIEGGLDIRVGGHFLFNVDAITTLRSGRSARFDLALGLGFIFGSGRR